MPDNDKNSLIYDYINYNKSFDVKNETKDLVKHVRNLHAELNGCFQLLLVGFSCFRLFSVAFRSFRLPSLAFRLSVDFGRYRLLSVALCCFQSLSVAFGCFRLRSVAFGCFRFLSFASGCFRLLSEGFLKITGLRWDSHRYNDFLNFGITKLDSSVRREEKRFSNLYF